MRMGILLLLETEAPPSIETVKPLNETGIELPQSAGRKEQKKYLASLKPPRM